MLAGVTSKDGIRVTDDGTRDPAEKVAALTIFNDRYSQHLTNI